MTPSDTFAATFGPLLPELDAFYRLVDLQSGPCRKVYTRSERWLRALARHAPSREIDSAHWQVTCP